MDHVTSQLPKMILPVDQGGAPEQIATPCLRLVGNLLSGTDQQAEVLVNLQVTKSIKILLQTAKGHKIRTALWCLSNIMAGPSRFLETCFDLDVISTISTLVYKFQGCNKTKIQAELFRCFRNGLIGATPNQVLKFTKKGLLKDLFFLA